MRSRFFPANNAADAVGGRTAKSRCSDANKATTTPQHNRRQSHTCIHSQSSAEATTAQEASVAQEAGARGYQQDLPGTMGRTTRVAKAEQEEPGESETRTSSSSTTTTTMTTAIATTAIATTAIATTATATATRTTTKSSLSTFIAKRRRSARIAAQAQAASSETAAQERHHHQQHHTHDQGQIRNQAHKHNHSSHNHHHDDHKRQLPSPTSSPKKTRAKLRKQEHRTGKSLSKRLDRLVPRGRVFKKGRVCAGVREADALQLKLPDILSDDLAVLFVGINPGVWSSARGHHYAGPGNHFWPCLNASGLLPQGVRLSYEDDLNCINYGIGFTNMVSRTTRGMADLPKHEIKAGTQHVMAVVANYRPRVVCFNGKGIYEIFSNQKRCSYGLQDASIHGVPVFVMPSTSPRGAAFPRWTDKLQFFQQLQGLVHRHSTDAIPQSTATAAKEEADPQDDERQPSEGQSDIKKEVKQEAA
ncbi:hypothetical protein PTSG_02460 [Salpingoeca rosetta]|uniref:G/T mismatch-specific thymine DNA glycosylase n=1 Tax=Salpingoeca rosetta (strain ATCC 50818 / BSB-021) TaxID=946362 RepID=F2U296_SALR5|nr:uncharacterized protein PTSG_02460 [Salpingoeca rosetta]EGD81748.1 hypothetical protein PTSG_02460 [Salpingoeca rosetta]|eukprot:XP_004996952.1 hypothetical protein PTSG_02460 [Salpingoeca rosetta]